MAEYEQRFWSKVNIQGEDECWEWTASRFKSGLRYGAFGIDCSSYKAHRIAWELEHGEIPEEQQVLHRCDNPICCNPKHLFLGTQADNMHDMRDKGRRKRIGQVRAGSKS